MIQTDIQQASQQKDVPLASDLKTWVVSALRRVGTREAELTLRLVDREEMQSLNSQFRRQDKVTNVLSFPCEIPAVVASSLLGDVVICAPVVNDEARKYHLPAKARWAHLVVHGVLHLCGFDHINVTSASKMENLESEILHELGFANPHH